MSLQVVLDEKAIIERFLNHSIPSTEFDCADMNTVFFSSCDGEPPSKPSSKPSSTTSSTPINRVQDLLDQLPDMETSSSSKKQKPGFAIIDRGLNTFKGHMFNEDLSPIKAGPDFELQLDAVRNFILLFRMIRVAEFRKMFDVTNNRVYSTFAAIDQAIEDNGWTRTDGTTHLPHNWAAEYKQWLEAYLDRMSGPVWTWTSAKWADLQARYQAESPGWTQQEHHDWGDLFNAIGQAPDFKERDFKCDFHLTWKKLTQPLYRRQLACPARTRADLSTRTTLLSSSTATDTLVQPTSTSMPLSSQNKPEPAGSSTRGPRSSSTMRTESSTSRSLASLKKPPPSGSPTRGFGSSSTLSTLTTEHPIDPVESPPSPQARQLVSG